MGLVLGEFLAHLVVVLQDVDGFPRKIGGVCVPPLAAGARPVRGTGGRQALGRQVVHVLFPLAEEHGFRFHQLRQAVGDGHAVPPALEALPLRVAPGEGLFPLAAHGRFPAGFPGQELAVFVGVVVLGRYAPPVLPAGWPWPVFLPWSIPIGKQVLHGEAQRL